MTHKECVEAIVSALPPELQEHARQTLLPADGKFQEGDGIELDPTQDLEAFFIECEQNNRIKAMRELREILSYGPMEVFSVQMLGYKGELTICYSCSQVVEHATLVRVFPEFILRRCEDV